MLLWLRKITASFLFGIMGTLVVLPDFCWGETGNPHSMPADSITPNLSSFQEYKSPVQTKADVFQDGYQWEYQKSDSGGNQAQSLTEKPSAETPQLNGFTDVQIADAQKKVSDDGLNYSGSVLASVNQLQQSIKTVNTSRTGATTPFASANIGKLKSSAGTYDNYNSLCVKAQATASFICREKTSPQLQDGINGINILMSGMSALAVKDTCDTMGKVVRYGQAALAAYQLACTTARVSCEASCAHTMKGLLGVKAVVDSEQAFSLCTPSADPASGPACAAFESQVKSAFANIKNKIGPDLFEGNDKSIAAKNQACTYSYALMATSAVAGIASMVQTFTATSNCSKNSDGGAGVAGADPCSIKSNQNTPDCICKANPRTPGCVNTLQKYGDDTLSSASLVRPDHLGGDGGMGPSGVGPMGGAPGPEQRDIKNPTGGGGGFAGSAGGSGGSLGGGSGFGNGSGAGGSSGTAGLSGSGLSADKYGTGFGGGGGGGSRYGSGGYEAASSDKYRAYLPGGAKDPMRGLAGQQSWAKEVTGHGGKSNWDKVKDRYMDNSKTLMEK